MARFGAGRVAAAIVVGAILAAAAAVRADEAVSWQALEPGLEYAEIVSPLRATEGDSLIRIARIDPTRFSVVLLNDNAMLGPAAAMSVLIVATSAGVVALQWLAMRGLVGKTQSWRGGAA